MVPAVAILFARNFNWGRRSSAHWRLIAAAGLSFFLAASDFREAQVARKAIEAFRERFVAELGTVWFQSHWGFQYYLQQWGARPLNLARSEIYSGDVMLIPANNTGVVPLSDRIFPIEELTFPSFPFFTTLQPILVPGFTAVCMDRSPGWLIMRRQPNTIWPGFAELRCATA